MSEATENLRNNQKQLDVDGCMVGVSRQALDEALLELEHLYEARDDEIERLQDVIREAHEALTKSSLVPDERAQDATAILSQAI